MAWASNPTIVARRHQSISFDDLEMAAYNFQAMLQRDMSLPGRIRAVDPSLDEVNVDLLQYPRKPFYFRHLISGRVRHRSPLRFTTIKETAPGFLEALVLIRDFECTDSRDKIFAPWDLARDKAGLEFKPDYSKPYEVVYAEFAQAWITQHRTLDMIGAVESTRKGCPFYARAPSWCPDWNTPATSSCPIRKDYLPP